MQKISVAAYKIALKLKKNVKEIPADKHQEQRYPRTKVFLGSNWEAYIKQHAISFFCPFLINIIMLPNIHKVDLIPKNKTCYPRLPQLYHKSCDFINVACVQLQVWADMG